MPEDEGLLRFISIEEEGEDFCFANGGSLIAYS